MENILVVEPISTGQNFIEDIIYRGYKPVALLRKLGADAVVTAVQLESLKAIPYSFDIIDEQDSYEETLELVKSFNPIVIVPGSESGVIMANRLACDLGLKGNPISRIDQMTKKNQMQEALKNAGIRSILGKVVASSQEALAFCQENNLKTAVIKPLESAGSMGVTLCDNMDEVKHAVDALIGAQDFYGRPIDKCLVQERIVGEEYIVNTVSCAGKHRLTSIFHYIKHRTSEGGYIYSSCELIDRLEPGTAELVRYAFDTASAIGFQYGEVHGEYMVDEKGPILIEVNCRPVGASMPARFLDKCLGQHETDSILDAYLDPDKFKADAEKPYHTYCSAALKFLMVPKRLEAESMPLYVIAENLRSTFKISTAEDNTIVDFVKTIDLETAGGVIYMIHDDADILKADLQLLCDIEKKYFASLINDGMSRRLIPYEDHMCQDHEQLIRESGCHGSTLLITDEPCKIKNVLCITPEEKDKFGLGFNNVVISLEQYLLDHTESDNMRLMFDLIKRAKRGGRVIISPSTYRYMSYLEQGAELMLRVLGLEIVSPKPEEKLRSVIGIMK